jgi:hypothetical protein
LAIDSLEIQVELPIDSLEIQVELPIANEIPLDAVEDSVDQQIDSHANTTPVIDIKSAECPVTVSYEDQICSAIASIQCEPSSDISIPASVTKARIFFRGTCYSDHKTNNAYNMLWYLHYDTKSGWNNLNTSEQFALLSFFKISDLLFIKI